MPTPPSLLAQCIPLISHSPARRSGVFHSEPRLAAALPRTHGAGAPLALLAGFAAAPHRRHPTRGWTRDTPASRRAEGHSFIKGAPA